MSFWERLLGGGHHRRDGHHGSRRYDTPDPAPRPSPVPAGVACPSCATVSAAAARFCQGCGQSLLPRGCAGCGATLLAGARFCGQCGAPATRP